MLSTVFLFFAALVVGAFLAGSIPFGYLIAKVKGVDIRSHGSGNIGATNVGRVLGKRWGYACFGLDFLKGLIPSLIAGWVLKSSLVQPLSPELTDAAWLACAIASVLGHMFTPWLKFKGGKGVATGFGALLGVFPIFSIACAVAVITWITSVKVCRMVGISSVLAGIMLALTVCFLWIAPSVGLALPIHASGVQVGFAVFAAALVTYKHKANIQRTLNGTESKIGAKAPV